jgi:hypothetical protein
MAASSSALDADVAVIISRRADHSVVVGDPFGQDARAGGFPPDPDRLLERFGPVRGVGDAIWRALSTVSAEIVCVGSECPLEQTQIEL